MKTTPLFVNMSFFAPCLVFSTGCAFHRFPQY